MSSEQPGPFKATPMTPPTEIGYAPVPPAPSSWPTVIGIIAIVFGAGGILGGCWGSIAPLMLDQMTSFMPTAASRAQLEIVGQWAGLSVALSAGALLVATLLLIAGIGLVKRTAWAARATIVWVVAKLLFVAGQSIATYFIQQETMAAISQSDPSLAQMPPGATEMMVVGGTACALLWGWALPIFMLIWFARGKIRAEVATWGGGRVRCPNPMCQAQNRADAVCCAKCGTRLTGGIT